MNIRRIIKADGTEVPLDKPVSLAEIEKLIGANTFDVVSLPQLGYPLQIMVVDDMGWETVTVDHGDGRTELVPTKARKPVNEKATALYLQRCIPGTTHKIVGDVAITLDEDFA